MNKNCTDYAGEVLRALRLLDAEIVTVLFLKMRLKKNRQEVCDHITDSLIEGSPEGLMWKLIVKNLRSCQEVYVVNNTLYVTESTRFKIGFVFYKLKFFHPTEDSIMSIATYMVTPHSKTRH